MTEEQRRKYLHDENGDTRTNDEIYRLIQIDGLQAQLSSKSQELHNLKADVDSYKLTIDLEMEESKSLRAENERLKGLIESGAEVYADDLKDLRQQIEDEVKTNENLSLVNQDLIIKEIELRKRCEDLEAALKGIIEDVDKQSMVTWVSGKIDTAKKLLSQ